MNANLLRGKIAEVGLTQGQLAEMAGMSSNSLSRKLSGKRDFRLEEVQRICSALNIDDPTPYFFAPAIPSTQHFPDVSRSMPKPDG